MGLRWEFLVWFGLVWFDDLRYKALRGVKQGKGYGASWWRSGRHLVGRVLASFGGGGGVINGEHVLFLLFMAEGVGGWMDVYSWSRSWLRSRS